MTVSKGSDFDKFLGLAAIGLILWVFYQSDVGKYKDQIGLLQQQIIILQAEKESFEKGVLYNK